MINEKKVEQVRKFCWDMYKELRSMRGKRKKIDIFAVEMTVMQLGLLANGMQEKEKESEQETRITNGQDLSWPLAMAPGPRTKLQAASGKLQAPSFRVDKTKLQGYSIL